MPRPKKPGDDGKETKKRSRNGCWPCKARKVKCGEEKPACANCLRQGETCDYSIRLNWDGRNKKKDNGISGFQTVSFEPQPIPANPIAISPPANGSNAPLAPAPNVTSSGMFAVPPDVSSRHSSGGSSDQLLPPLPSISHPPQATYVPPSHAMPSGAPILRAPNWNDPSSTNGNTAGLPPMSQSRQQLPYPSPADSSFGSPAYGSNVFNFAGSSMQMPPPMPTSNPHLLPDAVQSPYNNAKRMRLSPRSDSFTRKPTMQRSNSYGSNLVEDLNRAQFNPSTPTFFPPSYLRDPLTPATSSQGANDTDDRRISVSSLLSDDLDAEPASRKTSSTSYPAGYEQPIEPLPEHPPEPLRRGSLHQRMISYSETETYGHDRGLPDLDIPRNNDIIAISSTTPSEHSDFELWLNDTDLIPEFGFRLESRDQAFNPGGYYASPVPIKIPKKLEPLPPTLSDNPMNLLYFHHFLNHTARILVPHDCPENPFKTILPKMAVENENLLNLMLAYSASHRARLLGHREPANRIAHWVRDVFPSLRQTLDEVDNTEISNSNLATAIMLCSLEIISPSSFGVSIPWQNHLGLARSIIRARGGPHSVSRKDPVMYFLSRWLAYLDVLGSLSGRKNEEPLFEGNYWQSNHDGTSSKELSLADDDGDDDDDYTIDCLLGFTTRCVYILAKIASLSRQCAEFRTNSETGEIDEDWRPSPDMLKRAEKLRKDLENARNHEQRQCHHHSPVLSRATLANYRRTSYPDMSMKDAEETLASNDAFHWAGLIHLLRRVHNLPRTDPQVQHAVHEIVKILQTLREGGSAEACFLFPLCTAGFEAEDPLDRAEILARIKGAEDLGMTQVSRGRKIMEECWKTGGSWENLVNGEFFG